jgi:hypothetical protein
MSVRKKNLKLRQEVQSPENYIGNGFTVFTVLEVSY